MTHLPGAVRCLAPRLAFAVRVRGKRHPVRIASPYLGAMPDVAVFHCAWRPPRTGDAQVVVLSGESGVDMSRLSRT